MPNIDRAHVPSSVVYGAGYPSSYLNWELVPYSFQPNALEALAHLSFSVGELDVIFASASEGVLQPLNDVQKTIIRDYCTLLSVNISRLVEFYQEVLPRSGTDNYRVCDPDPL